VKRIIITEIKRPAGVDVIGIGIASIAFVLLLFVVLLGAIKPNEVGVAVEKLFHPEMTEESVTVMIRIKDGERWMFQKSDESDRKRFTIDGLRARREAG